MKIFKAILKVILVSIIIGIASLIFYGIFKLLRNLIKGS